MWPLPQTHVWGHLLHGPFSQLGARLSPSPTASTPLALAHGFRSVLGGGAGQGQQPPKARERCGCFWKSPDGSKERFVCGLHRKTVMGAPALYTPRYPPRAWRGQVQLHGWDPAQSSGVSQGPVEMVREESPAWQRVPCTCCATVMGHWSAEH